MWTQLAVGVGGMVLLGLLFGVFHVVSERMRAMGGDCKLSSVRCLGCLATGHCRGEAGAAQNPRRKTMQVR